jgi:hypothetical protein
MPCATASHRRQCFQTMFPGRRDCTAPSLDFRLSSYFPVLADLIKAVEKCCLGFWCIFLDFCEKNQILARPPAVDIGLQV